MKPKCPIIREDGDCYTVVLSSECELSKSYDCPRAENPVWEPKPDKSWKMPTDMRVQTKVE